MHPIKLTTNQTPIKSIKDQMTSPINVRLIKFKFKLQYRDTNTNQRSNSNSNDQSNANFALFRIRSKICDGCGMCQAACKLRAISKRKGLFSS